LPTIKASSAAPAPAASAAPAVTPASVPAAPVSTQTAAASQTLAVEVTPAGGPPMLNPPRRYALVIGNGTYAKAPLKNTINDANDMADLLEKRLGFSVIKKLNANRSTMRSAIREFGENIKRGDAVGLFYYSGHGIQVKGENYLVPVGADVEQVDEVDGECVKAQDVLAKMDTAGNSLNIIILDACRNNPFPAGERTGERGLAKMDAPHGSFLAYATAPGASASEGTGRNGLYTSRLLVHIQTPGLRLEDVFISVRNDVNKLSSGVQVPWESNSLGGRFYFVPSK
jgi:uncharacterized caspase-like protein